MPIQSLSVRGTEQQKLLQSNSRIPTAPGSQMQVVKGRLVTYSDNKTAYFTHGYNINDIVYSIIQLITDKIRVAPWGVYKVVDEGAYRAMKAIQHKGKWSMGDYTKAAKLQHKALEAVKDPGILGDLLKYPNEEETMSDLVANGSAFELLTGDMFMWANLLRAGANAGLPSELWLMPSQYTNIISTDTFPSRVTGYSMNYLPLNKAYTPEEVLHTKYWNPDYWVQGANHYGVAPLRAALGLLNRSNSSMEASISSFQNEGIKGIAYMENTPGQVDGDIAAAEVGKLAMSLRSDWRGTNNRGKMGLSGYTMGWLPIGLNAEEMQVIESEKWDLRRLCSIFGIQSQLLNDPDNKTYANAEEAEKSLTTRAALPKLTKFRDKFNQKLLKHWRYTPGIVIDFDLSVYSELQQDTKEMVDWLTPLMDRGLPLNRVLELLQLETLKNPYYDKPRVTPQMGQTLEDYELNAADLALQQEENEPESDNSNEAGD